LTEWSRNRLVMGTHMAEQSHMLFQVGRWTDNAIVHWYVLQGTPAKKAPQPVTGQTRTKNCNRLHWGWQSMGDVTSILPHPQQTKFLNTDQ
jgi:hypothetical protein